MSTPRDPQPYRQTPPPHGQQPPPYDQPQYGQRPPQPQQYGPPPQYGYGQQPPPPQRYGQPHGGQPQYGQPPAPQQQYGQQPQYGPSGEGIAVTTQFFPLAWVLFFVKPKIFVDGREAPPAGWGRTVVPAPPGQHHVHVYAPYLLPTKLGPADATAHVQPGQLTELQYKAPVWSFSKGSLGAGPQKYNGVGITLAVVAIPFVLVILMFLILILLSL